MANHCYNFVEFVGPADTLHKINKRLEKIVKEQIKENYTDKGLPVPSYKEEIAWINGANAHELLFKKEPSGNFDVYDLYGSKWFECYFQYNEGDEHLIMQGDSAWSPMLPLFEKICKKFKICCAGNYAESGMDFAGEFTIDPEGIETHDQMTYREYEAENNPNFYWEQVIHEIEEGYYTSLDAVYQEFASVKWKLSDEEKEIINKTYQENLNEG